MNRLAPREVGLIAATLALAADQGSKLFMLYGLGFAHMAPGEHIPVLPFFNLVMVWNPGISYGLFPASGRLGTFALIGDQGQGRGDQSHFARLQLHAGPCPETASVQRTHSQVGGFTSSSTRQQRAHFSPLAFAKRAPAPLISGTV